MRWVGYVTGVGELRKTYNILGRKPKWRTWRRWDDNIKMDLEEIWRGTLDCIQLAEDRVQWLDLANTAINISVAPAERISTSQEGLCSMELVSMLFRCVKEHRLRKTPKHK
jgi:hypothetical protein